MSKFDLREYFPLLGAMGYLDGTEKKQEELNNASLKLEETLENLKVNVSIECKNEEKYNKILNDLAEKYGAENKNDLGIISEELEKIFQKDIEKFLEAWEYILTKYKQYINEYRYIEFTVVDSMLGYVSRYDEDKEKQIKVYKFIQENSDIKEIVLKNKHIYESTTIETLLTILYEIKDYQMFEELFEIVYENRNKYLNFNFNDMLKDLIESRYCKNTSEGLYILKEILIYKEISEESYKVLEQKYLEVLEDERIEKEYIGEDEEIREFEYAKIVGVNHEERRKTFEKLIVGEEIFFIRERENKYDSNAIKVVNKYNETIGYVVKEKAQEIAPKLDGWKKCEVYVTGFLTNKLLVQVFW